MAEYARRHPLSSAPGALALGTWTIYILCALVVYYPNFLASVLIAGFFGLIACAAVVFGFRYWRATIVVASGAYLLLYAIKVIRMTAQTPDGSFLSAVSSYYGFLWQVNMAALQEKGLTGGVPQLFLEYGMPVLAVVLLAAAFMFRPRTPGVLRGG